jgi:hypothetical protein
MLDENESDEIAFEASSCAIYVQKTQVIVFRAPHRNGSSVFSPECADTTFPARPGSKPASPEPWQCRI